MGRNPEVIVRNLHFKFDPSIPRHWYKGSAAHTAFFDSQSLFFPAGERFFVDSVKWALPRIKDPVLLRNARAFCGQEGIHMREHVHYNQWLQARGYPALRLERWVARFLWLVRMTTLPRWQLAITCALEHFTAIAAARALGPRGFEGAEPRMRAFWRWHSAEELEHKAIPFDVYQAIGGHFVERVMLMLITSVVFRTYSLFHWGIFMWTDRAKLSLSALRATSAPMDDLAERSFPRDYLAYFKPGFHPSQLNDDQQLETFRTELGTVPDYALAAAR